MHIVNHAVIKGCMFMAACAFIYKFDLWDIRKFEGLGRRMPFTCFALLLAVLSMIGMPPSAGFVTKWYLILAALEAQKYVFIAFIFFSTLLMIVYFWRLIEIIYVRVMPQGRSTRDISIDEAPASMLVPLFLLGLATFGIGLAWISGIGSPLLSAINSVLGLGAP
jgi:multicomponent Na+:H+ antiporter subunit D